MFLLIVSILFLGARAIYRWAGVARFFRVRPIATTLLLAGFVNMFVGILINSTLMGSGGLILLFGGFLYIVLFGR